MAEALKPQIDYADFAKIDMRVGRIVSVEDFPEAHNPAYKLIIDFGPKVGMRQSSSQITTHYSREELVGRMVIGVVNFEPRRVAGFKSEVLTLGFYDAHDDVVLAQPERDVPLGSQLL